VVVGSGRLPDAGLENGRTMAESHKAVARRKEAAAGSCDPDLEQVDAVSVNIHMVVDAAVARQMAGGSQGRRVGGCSMDRT
jgi:hypothetical protein